MKGMIISNSSFSWWGAWFAFRNGAKVVRPSAYMSGNLAKINDIRDLYPGEWETHDVDSKIDLMDVTFTIPVAFDHQDRFENLRLCIRHLARDFRTNIILQEQTPGELLHFRAHAGLPNVIHFSHFKSKVFHRTKMLNEMAKMSRTPIVANWDADIVTPPVQLFLAAQFLRTGGEFCFPYDGRFARMDRKKWYRRLLEGDIGAVKLTEFPGMTEGFVSVGGAVMFDRKAFLSNGAENEKFISYGAEDIERDERFTRLGLKKHRVPGCLFHMDHFVGINSCKQNPYFDANEKELARIRGMSNRDLRKEFCKLD